MNTTLNALHLGVNQLGPEGAAVLCDGLKVHVAATAVCICQRIDVVLLQSNRTLTALSINENKLDEAGAAVIGDMLQVACMPGCLSVLSVCCLTCVSICSVAVYINSDISVEPLPCQSQLGFQRARRCRCRMAQRCTEGGKLSLCILSILCVVTISELALCRM